MGTSWLAQSRRSGHFRAARGPRQEERAPEVRGPQTIHSFSAGLLGGRAAPQGRALHQPRRHHEQLHALLQGQPGVRGQRGLQRRRQRHRRALGQGTHRADQRRRRHGVSRALQGRAGPARRPWRRDGRWRGGRDGRALRLVRLRRLRPRERGRPALALSLFLFLLNTETQHGALLCFGQTRDVRLGLCGARTSSRPGIHRKKALSGLQEDVKSAAGGGPRLEQREGARTFLSFPCRVVSCVVSCLPRVVSCRVVSSSCRVHRGLVLCVLLAGLPAGPFVQSLLQSTPAYPAQSLLQSTPALPKPKPSAKTSARAVPIPASALSPPMGFNSVCRFAMPPSTSSLVYGTQHPAWPAGVCGQFNSAVARRASGS